MEWDKVGYVGYRGMQCEITRDITLGYYVGYYVRHYGMNCMVRMGYIGARGILHV